MLAGVTAVRVFEVEKLGALDDALLEAEEILAAGVGLHGRRLAQDMAEVDEMLLVSGRFLALYGGFKKGCAAPKAKAIRSGVTW